MQLPNARNPRSGYAVLMVFCMAAMVSIMLYQQMPRVAFEAQRDKEELLMDRGKEYSRGIALYVRKFKKFPPTFEALEGTNGTRFLRKRYKDPMTGKDEWRVIHVGPNGVFTDSLVYGKKDGKDASAPQNFITELQQVGGNANPGADAGVNLATRRRQSDGPNAPGTGEAVNNGPSDPNTPGAAGTNPNQGQVQVLPDGRVVPVPVGPNGVPVYQAGQPPVTSGAPLPAGIAVQPGQNGLLPGQPGTPASSPTGGTFGTPYQTGGYSTAPGANGATTPPFGGQQPGTSGAASDLIKNLLTTPRPGGQFGTPVAASSSTTGTTTIGGGIGGVASTLEREGIKVFNQKTAYNEWEFVYDMSKDPMMTGQTGAAGQTGVPGQNGVPGQSGLNTPPPSAPPPTPTKIN